MLSILIVSYNTRQMTIECIRSIFRQAKDTSFEVVVVDNASSDGSADAIAAEFPMVKLIRSQENLGFARANNLAAERCSGEYILLLNPDTIVIENAVDELLEFASMRPDAKIWGGRTIFKDGSLNSTNCWRFMSLWSLLTQALGLAKTFPNSSVFNCEGYGGWARDSEREVDFVTGCFLLIQRSLWSDLGGFDESFFMYAEEADLCYRARRNGARPRFTPNATIVHFGGASETVFAAKLVRLLTGKSHFLRKHWAAFPQIMGITILQLWVLTRAVGYLCIANLSGREKSRQLAREWSAAWKARDKWSRGY